jgi:hypothetical protein
MPKLTIWKLVLITCIAGFAAAAVSISHTEEASIVVPETAAQTAPQMCGVTPRPIARSYRKYTSRYLSQTPVAYTPRRSR